MRYIAWHLSYIPVLFEQFEYYGSNFELI